MEYANAGLRFNAVAPGVVNTPLHKDDPKDDLKTQQPMGSLAEVEDIVEAVVGEATTLCPLPTRPLHRATLLC